MLKTGRLTLGLLLTVLATRFISSAQSFYNGFNPNDIGVTFHRIMDSLAASPGVVNDTFQEGGPKQKYQKWVDLWSGRVSINTDSNKNMFQQYYEALDTAIRARFSGSCPNDGFAGSWECIGPHQLPTQNMGYVESIWVDPGNDSNILVGTYGGLFRTTNGGVTWKCISDNAPIANGHFTVSSIAVKPGDNNTIYFGTGIFITTFESNSLMGKINHFLSGSIFKTTDGGQTWQQEIVGTIASPGDPLKNVQKIYFTPDGNYVIALRHEKIFIRPANGGASSWEEVTDPDNPMVASYGSGQMYRDLEFIPGDPNASTHFFVASANWEGAFAGGVYEVAKTGATWHITPIIDLGPANNAMGLEHCLRAELSIPDSDYLFAAFMNFYPTEAGVAITRYDLHTHTWTLVSMNPPNCGLWQLQGEMVVSPQKVQATTSGPFNYNIYAAGNYLTQSFDGGLNFVQITTYHGNPTHADIRGIVLHTPTNSLRGINDVVYAATDGGVAKKPAGNDANVLGQLTCIDISGSGLSCGNFYSFSTSEAGGLGVGGYWHNGEHIKSCRTNAAAEYAAEL